MDENTEGYTKDELYNDMPTPPDPDDARPLMWKISEAKRYVENTVSMGSTHFEKHVRPHLDLYPLTITPNGQYGNYRVPVYQVKKVVQKIYEGALDRGLTKQDILDMEEEKRRRSDQ